MKTATVRKLRHDFGSVFGWIEDGEPVQISRRGRVIAWLNPITPRHRGRAKKPDFMRRLKKLYADKMVSSVVMEGILKHNRGPW